MCLCAWVFVCIYPNRERDRDRDTDHADITFGSQKAARLSACILRRASKTGSNTLRNSSTACSLPPTPLAQVVDELNPTASSMSEAPKPQPTHKCSSPAPTAAAFRLEPFASAADSTMQVQWEAGQAEAVRARGQDPKPRHKVLVPTAY